MIERVSATISSGQSLTNLAAPLTLTVALDSAELAAAGGDLHRAQVARYSTSGWLGLGCTADEGARVLSCSAPYAGQFAVLIATQTAAVLDWDVHHCNGTQEIHWDDPSVLVVSLHQWPLYPGTGWLDETGGPNAPGTTINLPMPPGSGDREYLEALDRVALPAIEAFAPQLLLVSAGQDGHAADPLSNQLVSIGGFRRMATRAAELARRLGIGLVAVHEGGYNISTLPAIDRAILAGLGGLDVDESDLFVPPDAPRPEGWPARLAEIVETQRALHSAID